MVVGPGRVRRWVGKKVKGDTAWTRQLLVRGEVFVGEGDAALAAVFDDIAVIRGLGLNGVVNVPLCEGGRVIGTFNYLTAVESWTGDQITVLRVLGQNGPARRGGARPQPLNLLKPLIPLKPGAGTATRWCWRSRRPG